jgi:predicted metal-dependent phosphoesterase TrpH
VLARAFRGGLDVLALSDHDLPPSLRAGLHEADGRTLRVLAAAEVSGNHDGREFHLCVYFPGDMPPDFARWLRGRARERAARYDEAVARIGAPLPAAGADAHAGERSLTRYHLAAALLESGHCRNHQQAFDVLGGSRNVPLITLPFVEAIRTAREAGAFTSWAHPAAADAQRYAAIFARAGLHGVEVYRPHVDRTHVRTVRRLCKTHGMLPMGGSDWHGWWQGELGDFAIPPEVAGEFLGRLDG